MLVAYGEGRFLAFNAVSIAAVASTMIVAAAALGSIVVAFIVFVIATWAVSTDAWAAQPFASRFSLMIPIHWEISPITAAEGSEVTIQCEGTSGIISPHV